MKKLIIILISFILSSILFSCSGLKESTDYYEIKNKELKLNKNSEIKGIEQIENYTFIILDNEIIKYDCIADEILEFNIDIESINAIRNNSGYLYVFDFENFIIYEIVPETQKIKNTYKYNSLFNIYHFTVSDNYFIFYGNDGSQNCFYIVDKKSGEEKNIPIKLNIDTVINYKEDKLLLNISSSQSADNYFTIYDIKKDSLENEIKTNCFIRAATYNSIKDSIIFSSYDTITKSLYLKTVEIENKIIKTLKLFDIESDGNELRYISSAYNITSYDYGNDITGFYNLDEKTENITIASMGYTPDSIQYSIKKYSIENEIIVNEIKYDTIEKIILKTLAGDNDADIFLLMDTWNIADFIRNGAYEDLSKYDVMTEVLKKNEEMIRHVTSDDDKIIGVPIDLYYQNTDKLNSLFINQYSINRTFNIYKYIFDNINLIIPEYLDKDGIKLKQLFEYIGEFDPDMDYIDIMDGSYEFVGCKLAILSHSSQKKELSAGFLASVMQNLSDEKNVVEGYEYIQINYYPSDINYSNTYVLWKHCTADILNTLIDYADSIIKNKNSITEIAKEASNKLSTMLLE